MIRLFLVRHGWSDRDPATPPESWPLSEHGRRQAKALALPWDEIGTIVSSTETKAIETATLASGREPLIDPSLDEVRRPWTPGFSDALRAYFAGTIPPGWEEPQIAVGRAMDAIERHASDKGVAFFSHGSLLELVTAELQGVAPSYDRWSRIRFAGICEIDWPSRRIVKDF